MALAVLEALGSPEHVPIAQREGEPDPELLEALWELPPAEISDLQTDSFDWGSAESQLAQGQQGDEAVRMARRTRRPESEIYGRSLSTIRRLGAFMIDHVLAEAIRSPEAAQAKVEFFTSVEEGFGTAIELTGCLEVRDFDIRPVINGRVMAKDFKTAISSMTEAGLTCAEETAKRDPRFLPQLTRSIWDHENALTVDRMARGETDYNTRIVISPFPEEAAALSGDMYWRDIGYVPHSKRGFVQLYHATKNGLITGSLSFDGSNKHQLRELFGRYGIRIPIGEITDNWLKYAYTGTLTKDEAQAISLEIADMAEGPGFKERKRSRDSEHKKVTNTVDVTKQYKPLMDRVFNEEYVHICESLVRGYQTAEARALIHQFANKAHNFNNRYAKALYAMRASDRFTDADSIVLHELLVYSTIEMMRALHLEETALRQGYTDSAHDTMQLSFALLQAVDASSFQDRLGGFGADGARNNRTYSACGLSISLGDGTGESGPQSAYGGQDKHLDEDKLGSRWFTCRKGHLNYRRVANVKEKRCVKCNMDVSCKAPKPHTEKAGKVARQILTWETFLRFGKIRRGKQANIAPVVGQKALALTA